MAAWKCPGEEPKDGAWGASPCCAPPLCCPPMTEAALLARLRGGASSVFNKDVVRRRVHSGNRPQSGHRCPLALLVAPEHWQCFRCRLSLAAMPGTRVSRRQQQPRSCSSQQQSTLAAAVNPKRREDQRGCSHKLAFRRLLPRWGGLRLTVGPPYRGAGLVFALLPRRDAAEQCNPFCFCAEIAEVCPSLLSSLCPPLQEGELASRRHGQDE